MFFQFRGGFSSFLPATNWGDIFSQDKFSVLDSVYKWADIVSQIETRTCEAIIRQYERKCEYCLHKYIIAIRVKGGCGRW